MDDRDRWANTKGSLRGGCQLVGAVAIFCVALQEGRYLLDGGVSAWAHHDISGADFVLLLFVVPVVLVVALTALGDAVQAALEDRRQFYSSRRSANEYRASKGLSVTPPMRFAWLRERVWRRLRDG
jgi:hypothetical protein